MKRILSLVLALLMLSALALTAGAADPAPKVSMTDIIASYLGTPNPHGLITEWYGVCPQDDCGGVAYYCVKNGGVAWSCLKCGESGTYYTEQYGEHIHMAEDHICPICKLGTFLTPYDTIAYGDSLLDVYFCTKCQRYMYTPAETKITPYGLAERIVCPKCKKYAALEDDIDVKNGVFYAKYKCADGHSTLLPIDASTIPYLLEFSIAIYNQYGTWFDYDIEGGSYAKYDELKTVTFYPPKGYALVDVYVNGRSVEYTGNSVTFKVTGNTVVRPVYTRTDMLTSYTVTATASAGGSIVADKNGVTVSADKVTATVVDKVNYNFRPNSVNYKVADVTVDGKSIGAPTYIALSRFDHNHTISVTFKWVSPFADLEERYAKAVEYVTESGLMSGTKQGGKKYFRGAEKITVGDFVSVISELTDLKNTLKTDDDRVKWAVANGLIAEGDDLTAICNVQTGCAIVAKYLAAVEKLNGVHFAKFNSAAGVKDNAITLKLANEKTFDGNRDLNRYDLAAICRLISRLSYT